jgi:Tol biopolymer transport system component
MMDTNNPQNHARHQVGLIMALIILISAATLATGPIRESSAQADAPSWSYTGSLKWLHGGNTATLLPDGKVLVGGAPEELYDPSTGTWSDSGRLKVQLRANYTATLLGNGKVLVAGGYDGFTNSDDEAPELTNTAELYDPATGKSRFTGTLNVRRVGHTATLLPDGSNQTRLTADQGTDDFPKWSPDGRILFTSSRDGGGDIYVMDDDGANVTRLTKTRAGQPAWSPDGRKIAFVARGLEKIAGHFWLQVFVMDADGGNVRMLSRSPNSAFVPCWSPDGATIALVIENLPRANIFQIDLDGGNLRRVTAGPKFDGRPAFSLDGSKLAFQSNRDGNYEIYVMNLR